MTAGEPNRYRPPKAHVADVSPARELPPQPTTVLIAVFLLSVKLAIDVMVDLSALPQQTEFARVPLAVSLPLLGLAVLVFAWLIWKINAARNWARIAYLALLVCGLLLFAARFVGGIGEPVTLTVGKVIESLLPIAAMVLLFTPSANAWFRARKGA